MPVYEYRCNKCNEEFEEYVTSHTTADSEIECPNCRAHEVRKLISACCIGDSAGSRADVLPSGCGSGGFT